VIITYGGVLDEDGCQELIEDTAEMQKAWIEKMMEKGLCSCDEEHMFDCPASVRDVGEKPSEVNVEQQAFDDVLERILGEKVCSRKRESAWRGVAKAGHTVHLLVNSWHHVIVATHWRHLEIIRDNYSRL